MAISSAIAIYFVLWWVVLFAVLPFGVRSQSEQVGQTVSGSDPGAPVLPRMAWKLLWTTLISAAIFAVAVWAYLSGYLGIERLNRLMGIPF
jgi:predicted secreted protein